MQSIANKRNRDIGNQEKDKASMEIAGFATGLIFFLIMSRFRLLAMLCIKLSDGLS